MLRGSAGDMKTLAVAPRAAARAFAPRGATAPGPGTGGPSSARRNGLATGRCEGNRRAQAAGTLRRSGG